MKENKKIVKATNVRGNLKNSKLIETCAYYNIEFDDEQYHSAIYDQNCTSDLNFGVFLMPFFYVVVSVL